MNISQVIDRILILLMPTKYQPDYMYLRCAHIRSSNRVPPRTPARDTAALLFKRRQYYYTKLQYHQIQQYLVPVLIIIMYITSI